MTTYRSAPFCPARPVVEETDYEGGVTRVGWTLQPRPVWDGIEREVLFALNPHYELAYHPHEIRDWVWEASEHYLDVPEIRREDIDAVFELLCILGQAELTKSGKWRGLKDAPKFE